MTRAVTGHWSVGHVLEAVLTAVGANALRGGVGEEAHISEFCWLYVMNGAKLVATIDEFVRTLLVLWVSEKEELLVVGVDQVEECGNGCPRRTMADEGGRFFNTFVES